MKHWAGLLGAELKAWPGVTSRPMFGLDAYYRRGRIFAVLPRTRALGSAYSIAVKRRPAKRAAAARKDSGLSGAGWQSLEMESGDLSRALRWLERGYQESVRGIDRGRTTK